MRLDLKDSVFVSIDFQPRKRIVWTEQNILDVYKAEGFTLEELNDAVAHFHEVALPNAVRLAEFARSRGLPRVFVHWAASKGGISVLETQPRPHDDLHVSAEDVVIAKTEMDAFASSDIAAVLENIGRRTLLMVGGHTKGCLGETGKSAIRTGYTCVVVRDATFDCSIERWPKGIDEVPYQLILTTAEALSSA